MSELQQVIADLQRLAKPFSRGSSHNGMMEARRALKVLRAMARDFEFVAEHSMSYDRVVDRRLAAVRKKWRLQ